MDTRKIEILNAIIKSYIDSAVPVGSRTLSKIYELGVSSATIRNEMADLEDLGYLLKPHSSAGRVPSNKAYRFYVDEIMDFVRNNLENNDFDLDIKNEGPTDLIYRNFVKGLASSTGLFSFLINPKKTSTLIKHIELLKLDENILLLLLIGNSGQIEREVINYKDITESEVRTIKNILNEKLTLIEFDEISEIELEIKGSITKHESLITDLVRRSSMFNSNVKSYDIYYDGLSNILNIFEFSDTKRAVDFVSKLEDETLFTDIMNSKTLKDIDITIGDENNFSSLSDLAVIKCLVKVRDREMIVGVLGPVRMDYMKILERTLLYRNVLKNIMLR